MNLQKIGQKDLYHISKGKNKLAKEINDNKYIIAEYNLYIYIYCFELRNNYANIKKKKIL